MIQLELEKRHHAARLKDLDRLQRLDRYIDAGSQGRSEIQQHCHTGGVSRDVDELRKLGINVSALAREGRKIWAEIVPIFSSGIYSLATCPLAEL